MKTAEDVLPCRESPSAIGVEYAKYIDGLLEEAASKSAEDHKRTYEDGYRDAIEGIILAAQKTANDFFNEVVSAAEAFHVALLGAVPKDAIRQYRIGLDYATNTPVVLTILSHEYENKLEEIMDMAAITDMRIFNRQKLACLFWVITDDNLDQNLIDRDFPWHRRIV